MSSETRNVLLGRLAGDDPSARAALTDAAVSHALRTPLGDILEPGALASAIRGAVSEESALWAAREHIRPAIERQRARSAARGEKVGELLPPDAEAHLECILEGARLPETRWMETLVDRSLVNRLVSPIVQDALLSFAKRLPLPGLAGGEAGRGGGRLGGLAGSAGKLFDVGKSLVGGLSAEVERRLRDAAKEFAENVGDHVKGALRARLESEEGKRLVREIALSSLARLREVKVAEVLADVDAIPPDALDAFVAAIAEHNRAREAFAAALAAEVDAALAAEGEKTLGELLDRAGVRGEVEELVRARADAVLAGFFGSAEFSAALGVILGDEA